MEIDFETRMNILSEFLSGYYHIENDGYITSSETDCCVYNVMEMEGSEDVMDYDKEEGVYKLKKPLSICDYDLIEENDVVCNDWYGEYYSDCGELSETYTECDDYTILWIHPVKSGSVTLEVDTGKIFGDENTKYDTPYSYVVVGGKVYSLES